MTISRSVPAIVWAKIGIVLFVLLGWVVVASAQDIPPRPDGPIYDGADLLSPSTEADLDRRLRDYNRETGHAIIVATVPSIDGQPIEPYATRLFETWGIGGAERDTGLLLLIARDDRKMRIEVGYGLHPYFGGIMAGRVIRDTITPRFKQGNFDAGVTEGVDAILAHLANSPEDAIAIEEAAEAAATARSSEGGGFPIGGLIWIGFIFFFFILPVLRARSRSRRYRSKGKGPWGKRGERQGQTASDVASNIILWEIGSAIARGMMSGGGSSGGSSWSGGGSSFGGGGGSFGGFGGGMSGGGGASGGW